MESTRSKEIKVGIFAVLGIAAFLVSILLLGGDKMLFRSTYKLRVALPDVQGLARGSIVSLEGVPVGNVRTLTFIPGSTEIEVVMEIYTENRSRITQGSKASVKTQGALGDKFIYIQSGPLTSPPLAENSFIDSDHGGDLLDILSKRGAEFGQVIEVIKEVKELFYRINKDGRSDRLMQNLVNSTQALNETLLEAKQTMASFASLKPQMQSILTKIDHGDGTLGALVNDPTLHNKLLQLLGGSNRNKFLTPMIRESIKESEH